MIGTQLHNVSQEVTGTSTQVTDIMEVSNSLSSLGEEWEVPDIPMSTHEKFKSRWPRGCWTYKGREPGPTVEGIYEDSNP